MANVPKLGIKLDSAHADSIWTLCWVNNNRLVTASIDGIVKLWHLDDTTLKCIATSGSQKFGVNSVKATNGGDIVVVCYQDSTIRLLDLPNLTEISNFQPGMLEAWTVCLPPGDEIIASGNSKGCLNIWSMSEGHEKIATLETHNKFVLNSSFNHDGKLVATSGIDGLINVFDISTQQIVHKIEAHAMPARFVTFSPDGNLIYSASDDRHVSVYDTVSGTIVNSFSQSGMAYSVDASPDYRHFVVGCADHSVSYWDLGMQRRIHTFDSHKDQVWGVSFDKVNDNFMTGAGRFASVGDDALIQIYQ